VAEGSPIRTLARTRRIVAGLPGGRLDAILIAVVAALALGGAASVLMIGPWVRVVAPSLDLVLDTVTTLVTLAVAALGWIRYREREEPAALFQAAAFVVLALSNGTRVVLEVSGLDAQTGSTLAAPGQAPLYVFTLTRLLASGLLVVGSLEALRRRHPRRAVPVLAGAALATGLVLAFFAVPAGSLPALGSTAVAVEPAGTASGGVPGPSLTLLGAIAAALVAGLYLWASALSRRLYRRDGSIGDAYLAVGLVVASFAQVANAAFPGEYTGVVTSGDLLRLGFDLILLLGIQAELHATLGQQAVANAVLARLRIVEVQQAALAERARLSRELHDGLAQNLWLAKLKAGRLAALPDLGLEATALTDELGQAIDAGLAEAREAVTALRLADEPVGTLRGLLLRSADDFADRFGMRVEFECVADLPALPPRAQAEALRIAQEALSNVQRHADATFVRVRAAVEEGRLVVAVGDNGRGFNPDAVGQNTFGLASMRERAALIGGELRIESAPQDGTRVSLLVPLALAAAPVRVIAP
jgi:signal transduction histidine kinase